MLTFVAVGFQTLDLGGGGDDFPGDYERKLAEQQLLRERIKQQKEQNRLRKALSMKQQKQHLGSQTGALRCSGHVAHALVTS